MKPIRLKRSVSFLGIHFDFHATKDDMEIGNNVTCEMVEKIIEEVKPDYVQCDCKGHPGFSSYPTKVGYAAPGIKYDSLKIWREATAKNGVSLYMHYSGVWDTEALKHHPSWARIDEKGKRDKNNTSVFGPYVDKLLLPQLKELSDEYSVDGAWIDGECWATCQDYNKKVIDAFTESTGIKEVPTKPEDKYFYEFSEFCREGFRKYIHHYVNEIHKYNADFEVASNWAFTSFMPEPVNEDVDFISGDFSLQNSVNSARFEGRYMTKQDKPWDLMAWTFSAKWGEEFPSTKSPIQIKQEAAVVLALGGGFQAYFTQKRDGSVSLWQMNVMKEVAIFCRERQKFCHRAKSVPQVGIIYSTTDFYKNNNRLFGVWDGNLIPMQGVLQNILDNQYSVDILMEHHIKEGISEYYLMVIPEWKSLGEGVKGILLEYVKKGGSLLVIGVETTKLFKKELMIDFIGENNEKNGGYVEYNSFLCGMKTDTATVNLKEGAIE